MTDMSQRAHTDHLAQSQDHFRWRREHMEALAILKRAEAAIFEHEARILDHDAEIARHEEAINHGNAHADAPPAGEHARFKKAHAEGAEHHDGLLAAIRALSQYLESRS